MSNGNGETLESRLMAAANRMRGSMDPGEYKHIALGLLFLRYVSQAFEAKQSELAQDELADPEDRDEYESENLFWVPEEARWSKLQANARSPEIGQMIDKAMQAIEEENPSLKGILPKEFGRPSIDPNMLGGLIDLFGNVNMYEEGAPPDWIGRVYEYCIGSFASQEGKRGGEFYTPKSVVSTLVEMIEPFGGRVYDPCAGTGGMFVQSERFVEKHGGRIGDIAVYGQERTHTTWRLGMMNLVIRGIEADFRWNAQGSFLKDAFPDERFDFILANPPFNDSEWDGDQLRDDGRWKYGIPPAGNANFAWLQHILYHLSPGGVAGVVLANGSMSSNQSGEGEIRQNMIENEAVDAMVALPSQLFYGTQIPACLWFLAKDRSDGLAVGTELRDRRGEVLFIDARSMGYMATRTFREFSQEEIDKIARTYHSWRGETDVEYEDVPGFCRSTPVDEVREHGYVLTPGRYVGAAETEDDGIPFDEKMSELSAKLYEQFDKAQELEATIKENLEALGYGQ